jgi:hypothetical protein
MTKIDTLRSKIFIYALKIFINIILYYINAMYLVWF